jgi:hypothetical protein
VLRRPIEATQQNVKKFNTDLARPNAENARLGIRLASTRVMRHRHILDVTTEQPN